jgi:hypothetical protein
MPLSWRTDKDADSSFVCRSRRWTHRHWKWYRPSLLHLRSGRLHDCHGKDCRDSGTLQGAYLPPITPWSARLLTRDLFCSPSSSPDREFSFTLTSLIAHVLTRHSLVIRQPASYSHLRPAVLVYQRVQAQVVPDGLPGDLRRCHCHVPPADQRRRPGRLQVRAEGHLEGARSLQLHRVLVCLSISPLSYELH